MTTWSRGGWVSVRSRTVARRARPCPGLAPAARRELAALAIRSRQRNAGVLERGPVIQHDAHAQHDAVLTRSFRQQPGLVAPFSSRPEALAVPSAALIGEPDQQEVLEEEVGHALEVHLPEPGHLRLIQQRADPRGIHPVAQRHLCKLPGFDLGETTDGLAREGDHLPARPSPDLNRAQHGGREATQSVTRDEKHPPAERAEPDLGAQPQDPRLRDIVVRPHALADYDLLTGTDQENDDDEP